MSDIYTTADINAMMAEDEAQKKRARRPMSNAMLGGILPQVPAQEAAQNRSDIEAQRGQPGVISKLLIGGAANAADAVGMPGVFDPSGDIRNQTWGNALRASSWIPQDTIEGVGQAITAPRRTYEGELTPKGGVYQDDSGAYVDEIGKPLSAYRDEMISEGLNVAGNMAIGGSVVPKPSNAAGMFGGRLTGSAENAGVARSLDTDIARQIHDAQRAANPAADPNRLAQIAKRPSDDHPFLQDARGHRGNEWEVSSPVGNIIAYEGPQGVQIKGAGLDEGVPKGMGYGMPLYETLANEAAAAGKTLASDQIVSKPAQNVYGALSRRGYDVYGPPANALRHPDSGSLIANEPIYNVSAPNFAPREMPPPLPDILYGNGKSSGVPGAVISQAGEQAPRVANSDNPLIELLRRYGVTR